MNIYLRMVIPAREYSAKLLLGVLAASRGHDVVLGDMPKVSRGFSPGIFHTNDLGLRKAPRLAELARAGFVITAQDEEHGLTKRSMGSTISTRFDESTLEHVSASFSWGPWDWAALRSHFPKHSAKFVLTGSPRVDLWRRDVGISPFVERRAERLRADASPTILVVTNFGLRPTPWWIATGHTRGSAVGMTLNERIERMSLLVDYQRTAVDSVAAIHALSKARPEARIVVRPHPTETWGALSELIGPLPNVLVTREATTTEWLRVSDLMIHSGSTTAFESVIGGTPSIAFTPGGLNADFFTNSFSTSAHSTDELLEATHSALDRSSSCASSSDPREADALARISERIFMPEDTMSASLMVDHWEHLASSRRLPASDLHRSTRMLRSRATRTALPGSGRAPDRSTERRPVDSRGGEVAHTERDESVRFPPFRGSDVISDATAMAEALDVVPIDCRLVSERLILLAPKAAKSGRSRRSE